jgi:hypothetical protein
MISKLLKQISRKRATAKKKGLDIIETEALALLALKSPHWRQIGRGKGKYNFCRRDHSKGYTAENTFIGSFEENMRERDERCGKFAGNNRLPPLTADEMKARQNALTRARRAKNATRYSELQRNRRAKKKAAAAGKAATASNSTPMNINLGEEHDVEQIKI